MPLSMTLRALALLILVLIASSTYAQSTTDKKTKRRPNIPGSIIVDFGLNGTLNSPNLWKTTVFGSRTVNIYYQYPMRFGRSRFSFNPGAGFSFERFRWNKNTPVILSNPTETGNQIEKYEFGLASARFGGNGTNKKITLVNNYFEIPIEIRYDSKPEDISRSFNVAIGARGGFLYDSFLKVKYKDEGQNKKMKDKQDWGLTQLRYGVYTRIGIGGFNFFAFYNLSPLFQKDKGPYDQGAINTNGGIVGGSTGTMMNTFTAGISLNGF